MGRKLKIVNLFLFSWLLLLANLASNCAEKQKKSDKKDFYNINDAAGRIFGNFTKGPVSFLTSLPNLQIGGQKMTPKLDELIEFILTPKITPKSEDFLCAYLQQIAKSMCKNAQIFECKSGMQEKLWLKFNASASECEIKKQEDIKILSSLNTKTYLEIPTYTIQQGKSKFNYILEQETEILLSKIKSQSEISKIRIKYFQSGNYEFVISITNIKFLKVEQIIADFSGPITIEDVLKNTKEEYSIPEFKMEIRYLFSEGGTEPIGSIIKMEGTYSLDTSPDSCVEGTFKFETIEPLKLEGKKCPVSGKIKVNNAYVEFSPDTIKITLDNESKNYSCEDLENMCKYEPVATSSCSTASALSPLILVFVPIIFYIKVRASLLL